MESISEISLDLPDILELERDLQFATQRCSTPLSGQNNLQQNQDDSDESVSYNIFKKYLEKIPLNPPGSLLFSSTEENSSTELLRSFSFSDSDTNDQDSNPYYSKYEYQNQSYGGAMSEPPISSYWSNDASWTTTECEESVANHSKKLATEPKSPYPYITLDECKVGLDCQFELPGINCKDNSSMLDRLISWLPTPPQKEPMIILNNVHPFATSSLLFEKVASESNDVEKKWKDIDQQSGNIHGYGNRSHEGLSASLRDMGGSTDSNGVRDMGGYGRDMDGYDRGMGGNDRDMGGYDSGMSGYDRGMGGYDRDMSGTDRDVGGYDRGMGGYDRDMSGTDCDVGGYDRDMSGTDRDVGGYDRGMGGYDRDMSGTDRDVGGYDRAMGGYGHGMVGYDSDIAGYDSDMGGYGHGMVASGRDMGGYGRAMVGYGRGMGGFARGMGGYGHGMGGFGHGSFGFGRDMGGYGRGMGGYGSNEISPDSTGIVRDSKPSAFGS